VSEPLAIEPEQAPAEGQGQAAPAGFGYALAQMRVRVGLSIEQAAGRLRLHPKQLRALEAEDLEALPAAAYVNGFVRNYARELGMDPGPLLEDLSAKLKLRGLIDNLPDFGSAGAAHPHVLDDRGWRHLVLAGIVIALVCAGLIGVWMARSGSAGRAAAAPEHSSAPSAAPQPAAAPAAPVAPAAPTVAAGSPESAGAAPGREAGGPSETASGRAPIVVAVTPEAPDGGATPVAEAGAGATASAAPTNPGPAARTASSGGATGAGLVLRFNDRSWFQVSRPDGRVLMSHNAEAGSMELVNAAPPLQLVVGRAGAVQVEYRGQPVNLKPYVNSQGVARLTLGDARPTSGGQNSR
jgi:cytoskeleton protein RodZ